MPGISVQLETDSNVVPVLTLSSVPATLYRSICKGRAAIQSSTDGLPALGENDDELMLRFPKRGLPDYIRYEYTKSGELIDVGERDTDGQKLPSGLSTRQAKDRKFSDGSILLLLESPHDTEMQVGQPAAGSTGGAIDQRLRKFEKMLRPMVESLFPEPKWDTVPFVIANPCPYPTSCLAATGKWYRFRDLVFEHFFALVQDEFIERVKRYRPFVIINACTDGAEDGGHIIHIESDGIKTIMAGYLAESPKAMVNDSLNEYVRAQAFEIQTRTNKQEEFRLDKRISSVTGARKGYLVNLAHPASWRG